jgi:glutamyl-tRNA reductase
LYIYSLVVNHKTASFKVREKVSSLETNIDALYEKILQCPAIQGCVIISTCNRFEVYLSTCHIEEGMSHLKNIFYHHSNTKEEYLTSFFVEYQCIDAVKHLFEVVSGLDSLLLGEDQILHQIRSAYKVSYEKNAADKVLHTLFQRAIHVGKKVRTTTKINQQSLSYPGLCVDICRETFPSYSQCDLFIIGSGEMGMAVLKTFYKKGLRSIRIACRSSEKMTFIKKEYPNVEICPMDQIHTCILHSNYIVSCIRSEQPLITKDTIHSQMNTPQQSKIVFVDLSVPRSISTDIQSSSWCELYDMDTLSNRIQQSMNNRSEEIEKVSFCIDQELDQFTNWLRTKHVEPTICALKETFETIKDKELERAYRRFETLSDKEKQILQDLAHSITYKILHHPIQEIKNVALENKTMDRILLLNDLFHLKNKTDSQNKPTMLQDIDSYDE